MKKSTLASGALRDLVQEVGPDGKLPTYLDLLQRLSVSRTTLNAALDELESQRVIYRRHGVGIFAASRQQTHAVGLVCDPLYLTGESHSPFWDVLLDGVRQRAVADAFTCELHFCKNREPDTLPFSPNLLNTLQARHLQGVLGVGMNRAADKWLKEQRIPYVSFGGPGTYQVRIDSSALIQSGVRQLQQAGARRIALLSAVTPRKPFSFGHSWETYHEVFRMALAHYDLPFDDQLVKLTANLEPSDSNQVTHLSHFEQGSLAVRQLFCDTTHKAPQGLLVTDDVMTLGVISALRVLGLEPGRDVHIATHSNRNTSVLKEHEEVVHRLEIDPQEIVDAMFLTVQSLIEGKKPANYIYDPTRDFFRLLVQPRVLEPASVGV